MYDFRSRINGNAVFTWGGGGGGWRPNRQGCRPIIGTNLARRLGRWLRSVPMMGLRSGRDAPANTKHLYNIYTTLVQRLRRWSNIVQMLYKWFVVAGYAVTIMTAIDCGSQLLPPLTMAVILVWLAKFGRRQLNNGTTLLCIIHIRACTIRLYAGVPGVWWQNPTPGQKGTHCPTTVMGDEVFPCSEHGSHRSGWGRYSQLDTW